MPSPHYVTGSVSNLSATQGCSRSCSGRVFRTRGVAPRGEVDKLVAGLEAHPEVAILSDEIYSRMVYDNLEHVSLLAYPSIRDRLILLDGWSKTYAMTGWRLGYVSASPRPTFTSYSATARSAISSSTRGKRRIRRFCCLFLFIFWPETSCLAGSWRLGSFA